MKAQRAIVLWSLLTSLSVKLFSQSTTVVLSPNPIGDFFTGLATSQFLGEYGATAAYGKLTGLIEAMTPAQITAGIEVIDRELDKVEFEDRQTPEDRQAKEYAVNLFTFIGRRPDGPKLLASQVDRLSTMLNDPYSQLAVEAVTPLRTIYRDRPDLLVPIFEAPLKAPELPHNGNIGIAPVLTSLLLYLRLPGDQVANAVAQYMRRPELADDELLYTIKGIDALPVTPDALVAELVRSLDRPNERIKVQALIGISKGNPSAKDAAQARIQTMADDPNETANVRKIAAEALLGKVTEKPDPEVYK